MALSTGSLLYSSCYPILKTYAWITCGYALSKLGVLRPSRSRVASLICMNVALPALIFANTIPAFTPQNAPAMGPIFMLALVYQLIGFAFGMIIREVTYVPRNFWQGIVVMCGMSNWANLPTSVVMSVMEQPPFDPRSDPQLGVSFVSFFIVAYHIIFWVTGVAYSLAWDYLPGVPQKEDAERRYDWYQKPFGSLVARFLLGRKTPITFPPLVPTERKELLDGEDASGGLEQDDMFGSLGNVSAQLADPNTPLLSKQTAWHSYTALFLQKAFQVIVSIFTPITTALFISIPIALVRPLKGLFVPLSVDSRDSVGSGITPPLLLVIHIAHLLGSLAVPLALLVLGASFARCRIPRLLSRLPVTAMLASAAAKMIILPAIGICLVRVMVNRRLISRDAKVEQFVAMFLSGSPAAINQLIVASLYAPDGDVDVQAMFFLVQYAIMFFTSSALTAICIILVQR